LVCLIIRLKPSVRALLTSSVRAIRIAGHQVFDSLGESGGLGQVRVESFALYVRELASKPIWQPAELSRFLGGAAVG
jgi:hypothetical protein